MNVRNIGKVFIGIVAVGTIVMFWWFTQRPETMVVGTTRISVEVVTQAADVAKGLGGRSSLSDGSGMLFVFPTDEERSFWMKDMRFPIDIIWIRGTTVTGIVSDAKPPKPGTPDRLLERFTSPGIISSVLEVPAGFAASHHISVGTMVSAPE